MKSKGGLVEDIPLLFGKEGDSRQLILSVLSKKSPLSAHKIYLEIGRDFGKELTYQGVHKALKTLERESVVVKTASGYVLDPDWILSLKLFFEELTPSSLPKLKALSSLKPYESVKFHFDTSISEPYYWLLNEFYELFLKNQKKTTIVMHWDLAWPPMILSRKDYLKAQDVFTKNPTYILCRTSLPVDKFILDFWISQFKAKGLLGVDVAKNWEVVVFYDYIVQKRDSPESMQLWRKAFRAASPTKIVDLARVLSFIFNQKSDMDMIIHKNPEFADQIRKETLQYFR